mmetsp:Transcript_26127/g.60322  ORF Transcript_26127/g.60322 Transcript_26127/m.60322 type:complete len:1204 (+) Transcript_26127:58-3669(+)|eukprot:CAMPEP_0114546970 /NCGR_PEP_ID=MMETSP0114-20121206/4216_1 /TAXON_ID=31324 /ORGANISM="Goniomonas sp, Strain m" /LENGTH=1203 /DNA_ID=CAMNT_0001731497 /DNA_START=19 /DNA_END=3630 /DNA_ORIENTATION=+
MRTVITWQEKAPDRDGVKSVVYDIAFKPDGSQMVVACGNRVLIYDAADGDLLHTLKGHKDTVYAVSYSRDGKRFASGGADKTVIIWKSNAEGILKYTHHDSIQDLQYNPLTQQLASVTAVDFGLWSPEQKSVAKHKLGARALCSSWTNDGQHLALGLFNGEVTIRNKQGIEKVKIERHAPVWALSWNPSRDEPSDIIAVACWDQTLSFYQLSGTQVGKDRQLDFDPCSLGYFSNGEYLCLGGSDRKVSLWTKEGVRLTNVAERADWVWCVRPRPKQNYVAVGCNDGTLTMHQLMFSTVHGLYQDRYAYRDFMTDVIIQHLVTEQKVRIKCRDYVKKIAVYKNRLAVQLPDRVLVYELTGEDENDMHYKVQEKIHKALDCNLLVVTYVHIILCLEKKLQLFNFQGVKEREWVLDAVIRYIKVVGGPPGREGLLVGLKNGRVLKIFVDNPFPMELVQHTASIRCLDLSASRRKLAVVDDASNVVVFDVHTREKIFEDSNANSVAWNSLFEDTVCYSGKDSLAIKTGSFPVHREKLQGFVVGVRGSKVFCLHFVAMKTVDVPQSAAMYRYLEKKDFDNAFKVACLGVTDHDWRALALSALSVLKVEIAHKAFIRVRDMRYIEMINKMEQQRKEPGFDDNVFLAEVLAYQGRYQEAAKVYAKAGLLDKVIEMFSDLRQYDEAKIFAENYNVPMQDLIRSQAVWCEEKHDWKAASKTYGALGDWPRAIKIMGENGWVDDLIEVVRKLPKTDLTNLKQCAELFRHLGHHAYAKESILKCGDTKMLMELHVELEKWDDAFALAKLHPELGSMVYLPYANSLMLNDKFEDAQDAFRRAGRPEQAIVMLEKLTHNSVIERRYGDAAYYFHVLAMENLKMVTNPVHKLTKADEKRLRVFNQMYATADMYYAYHCIYRYTTEPFTSLLPEAVFNTARFLLSRLSPERGAKGVQPDAPLGISKVNTVYALAKQAKALGAYKLCRTALERLQGLKVPAQWRDAIDLMSISIRATPFEDKEELKSVCSRCTSTNDLLSPHSAPGACSNCGQKFIKTFCSFEDLPLVEFYLEDSISDEEAEKLINEDVPDSSKKRGGGDQWRQRDLGGDVQTLRFDDDDMGGGGDDDIFARAMLMAEGGSYQPIKADRKMLRALSRLDVFIQKWPSPGKSRNYFRNMLPDVPIVLCESCNHMFLEEDFELAFLQKNACPFCRTAAPGA